MMARSLDWIQQYDRRIFRWFNRKLRNKTADLLFRGLTHLGGAIFTIVITLSVAVLSSEPWSFMGWQSFAALSISFLITAVLKRRLQRIRPYLALEEVHVGKNPLKDPSFPSGHSTAIFSIITPFLFVSLWLSLLLILIACTVSLSRIYLGFHYPSDCLAGCIVGLTTGMLIVLG